MSSSDNHFSVEGVDEFLDNLRKIKNNANEAGKRAIVAGAEVIRKAASEKCPRGSSAASLAKKYSKGQHLADNIIISPVKVENGEGFVEVGPQRGDNNDFFYGKMIEFGTIYMDAQPFVEPAVIEKREEALETMANVLREAIERV